MFLRTTSSSAYIAAVENAGAASGRGLKIKVSTDGRVMVNNASDIESGVKCGNGTIQMLDQLLINQ